jgi:biopolymer transport protein ExbD
MKRNLFQNASYTEINLTPLSDLAWNLLIVFIIASTAMVHGVKVNLPRASAAAARNMAKAKTRAVSITAGGKIYLDTFPVTIEELETKLRQCKSENPDLPVVVRGDEQVSYKLVIEVLDILARLNITQLGLVTQKLVR